MCVRTAYAGWSDMAPALECSRLAPAASTPTGYLTLCLSAPGTAWAFDVLRPTGPT
eukprot:CAMPEP_0175568886 /NCGR_PEP_ID=MMETSP0096-20121207/41199_1 /TAXON_ID=311494 /ORGANISM="Alexandrium monilatum, Strain CCMP3105" /LENGTH=55 /DNA_ID=CAMNT_0016872235 /DNA_START=119 /DNA_END=282 /DNA_ORIENTATION=+